MAGENGYSLADIAAAMGGNGGFGGANGSWLVVLFLFVLMGGNGGFGWGGNNQYATSNEVQRGFDNQNSMANQREILSAVNAGTAQSVAATNQVFHDLVGYVGDKYAELDRDVLGVSAAIQQSIANENQCCCNTLRAIDGVKYENAQNTALINANTTAQVQKILDAITGNRMADMQNQINQLSLANQMLGVVKYPMASTYNSGSNPFCNCNGCGLM